MEVIFEPTEIQKEHSIAPALSLKESKSNIVQSEKKYENSCTCLEKYVFKFFAHV